MKNIHILPTYKPSRLHFTEFEEELVFTPKYEKIDGVNIYITSDEEIKEGDWFIWKDTEEPYIFKCIGLTDTDSLQVENSLTRKIGTFHRNPKDSDYGDWYRCYSKKIVLTADQDLINDGVQAIDDEFLEWFVKNPSCEEFEVETEIKWKSTVYDQPDIEDGYNYKIIIPKEELKQIKCYCGHTTTCDCIPEEPKQLSREEIYIKKEFPKNKPTKKGFYITDYNSDFENSEVEWFGEKDNDGWCFINSSGGIVDKQITWFMEKITFTSKEESKCFDCKENISKEGICFCNRKEPKQVEEAAKSHAIYELENNYKPTKESFKLACKRSFIKGANVLVLCEKAVKEA